MKHILGFYLFLIVWALAACSDDSEEYKGEECISLNVSVSDIEAAGRAAKVNTFKGEVPTTENELIADVWFSNASGVYKHDPVDPTYLPCHTWIKFDGTLQYAFVDPQNKVNNLKYYTQNLATDSNADPEYAPVYCVGLYPKEAWKISDTDYKTATATIDGSKDLMFAPQINGTWVDPLSSKALEFEHQLTWLKVCICATSQEASAAWGEVTNITVKSASTATVDLGNGNVTFNGDVLIPVFDNNSEDYANLKNLHTTMKEVGSVCCSPTSGGSYEVTVTVGGKTITKSITLYKEDGVTKYTGSTQGKLFVLTLYFNDYDVVEGVCTLTAWNEQNEDLYLK